MNSQGQRMPETLCGIFQRKAQSVPSAICFLVCYLETKPCRLSWFQHQELWDQHWGLSSGRPCSSRTQSRRWCRPRRRDFGWWKTRTRLLSHQCFCATRRDLENNKAYPYLWTINPTWSKRSDECNIHTRTKTCCTCIKKNVSAGSWWV